jgi:peptide/nickel transport system substrate-binding protein
MKLTRSAKVALAIAASAGLAVSLLSPASANTRSTVVVHDTNSLTSFNSGQPDTNLTINGAVGYLSDIGFNYYDDKKNVIQNKVFGSYRITKNGTTDFRVTYTVNPGRVWSDGTPITAVDLLLSHVLSSNEYSKAAGLGDPLNKTTVSAFDSNGYSGTYNDNIAGEPTLSADQMSLTLQYKNKIANWDLFGPGPAPVHALILMSEGKKALGTVAENTAAKGRFLAAYNSKNTNVLKAMGKVWSNDYDIADVNSSTNPLLFVGNGGFLVQSAVKGSSVTMKRNPRYNSGPALSGTVDTVIFRFIADGTAASQALANGELDIYQGQATADAVAALNKIKGVTVKGGIQSCYEHWDTRVNAAPGQPAYNGLFKGHGGKGADLRRAFLLAIPRAEINEKLIAPINPSVVVLGSTFVSPGEEGYDRLVANNGSNFYVGTQDALNAKALRLVKKHFPSASPSNPVAVKVLVPGNNARRAAEFALAKANAIKAGFDLQGDVQASWSPRIQNTEYDAMFFAYCQTAVSQTGTNSNFKLGGGNNRTGVNLPNLDAILDTLQLPLSRSSFISKVIAAERIIHAEGLTVGVFQFPAVTAYNSNLKGVKPAALSPTLVWNWWEWSY